MNTAIIGLVENIDATKTKVDKNNKDLVDAVDAMSTQLPEMLEKKGKEAEQKIDSESQQAIAAAESVKDNISVVMSENRSALEDQFAEGIKRSQKGIETQRRKRFQVRNGCWLETCKTIGKP